MSKALNALINASEENRDERNQIKLSFINVLHPKGGVDKYIVKEKQRNPMERVVLAVREVTYIYDKKQTKGFEIVEEVLVPRDKVETFRKTGSTKVVEEVVRDFRSEAVKNATGDNR